MLPKFEMHIILYNMFCYIRDIQLKFKDIQL